MTKLEIKIARRVISSRDYRTKRLDQTHREIVYWVASESVANTLRQKQLCKQMQEMYVKRYNYYLNGFGKSNG